MGTLRKDLEGIILGWDDHEGCTQDYMRYDVVCDHDDSCFCDHRQKHLIEKILKIIEKKTRIIGWEKPRHQCLSFMMEQGDLEGKSECLPEEEFNEMVESGEFEVGPFKEDFGSGSMEPYNPWRQAFGKLKDGRLVFTELYKEK